MLQVMGWNVFQATRCGKPVSACTTPRGTMLCVVDKTASRRPSTRIVPRPAMLPIDPSKVVLFQQFTNVGIDGVIHLNSGMGARLFRQFAQRLAVFTGHANPVIARRGAAAVDEIA